MALGTLDSDDRPWCTVWGTGEPPLAQQVGSSVLGVRSVVDGSFDPVVRELLGGKMDGEVVREEGKGRMVSGVSVQLEERGRVKLYGRMVAGALSAKDDQDDDGDENAGKAAEAQLVLKIEQSLGNCPKYLNRKTITSNTPQPRLLSSSPLLSDEAIDLIHKADLFFVASAQTHEDMDCNHRGGPPGFIRVTNSHATSSTGQSGEGSVIVWPEYSGNNLYQTLGNLISTPRAGLCIPDFPSGDVLYLTGTTEVLVGEDASSVIAKSKLAVKFVVTGARHVKNGLPFIGTNMPDADEGRSPYNPRIRYLTTERQDEFSGAADRGSASLTAKLIKKTQLTPTIYRYRFSLSDPEAYGPWKPGQYVAFDFSDELDMGYSHMRDDDPTSLNDDYLRTFTVSSIPGTLGIHGEEFEITVRKVGSVTSFLSWQKEGGLEVEVKGFGGEFRFDFSDHVGSNDEGGVEGKGNRVGFVAAGIGITPLLGQMGEIAQIVGEGRVRVLWSVGIRDAGLVNYVIEHFPVLKGSMTVFLTGDEKELGLKARGNLQKLMEMGVSAPRRRLAKQDLDEADKEVDDWYLCTAPAMRKQVQEWLPGKSIIFENFDY